MKFYRIKKWDTKYENNHTRLLKSLKWFMMPVELNSDGYTLMMSREENDGPALFGAFIAAVEVAADCKMRGSLIRTNGFPHDADSISRLTRMQSGLIQTMLDFCTARECGWMEFVDTEKETEEPAPETPSERFLHGGVRKGAVDQKRLDQKRLDQKEASEPSPPPEPPEGAAIKYEHDTFQYCFAKKLYEKLAQPTGAKRPDLQKWAAIVNRMLRLDKRTVEYLEQTLHAVLAHEGSGDFRWANVIKSAEKFRLRMNEGKINPQINKEIKHVPDHRAQKRAREHREELSL